MRKTPLCPSALADRLSAQFHPSTSGLIASSKRRLLPDASRARSRLLLSRALSNAADPFKKGEEGEAHGAASSARVASSLDGERDAQHVNGFLNGAVKVNGSAQDGDTGLAPFVLPLANAMQSKYDPDSEDVEHVLHDIEFTAQRIGFPMVHDDSDDAHDGAPALDEGGEDAVERLRIREESREHATAKAERVLAILRHSMTELDISKVIHRVAQYATLPRVTALSRKQFLRSLENRFGPEHREEYEYFLAFLQGKDDTLDGLETDATATSAAATAASASGLPSDSSTAVDATPAIMGLHPDLAADPQFIGIVFCYCRLACLNSLKLVQRPSPGQQRGAKSSLWQVKNDFRKVLDTEGLSHYADLMGLEKPSELARDSSELTAEEDAEWQEFNLENDRIDFRMLMAQTQDLIELLKRELPSDTIAKMLITMLASLKTSKLHRKIFQEMVCNLQTAFPAQFHEEVLSSLVPFLSGNNATFADFDDSALAANTLQHHRMRHEAILRALLECRMRVGHLLIQDIDSVDPALSVSQKLTPEQHEKVIATAWNLVNVLDDRQYHMFFSRFLKYKLAWRPNRATFGQTFLKDIRKTLGPRTAALVMPLFEQTYNNLSVETLTICRVKARHARKLLRAKGELKPLDERAQQAFEQTWRPDRSVFYRNLPHGVTEKHLRDALAHVGDVERFFLFADPVVGAPDEQDAAEDPAAEDPAAAVQSDEEDDGVASETVDASEEDDEEVAVEDAPPAKKKASARGRSRALKTPKRKTHVIASDTKTKYHALVEFSTPEARDRALMRALQIFGVMMAGWKEYRPVFSSDVPARTSIFIQNIPFGTPVGELLDEVNRVLDGEQSKGGGGAMGLSVTGTVPREVIITSGRMELRFESFREAAHVVARLNEHVRFMKSRRPPAGEDANLVRAKALHKDKMRKALRRAASDKKKSDKLAAALLAKQRKKRNDLFLDPGDDEDEEGLELGLAEEEDDDEEEEDAAALEEINDDDEDEDAYFEAELAREAALTPEQRALGEVPRPFDVTWSPAPRARNKHVYL